MDELSSKRRYRAWIIAAGLVAVVIVAVGLLLLPNRTHGNDGPKRTTASLALARLDASDGNAYIGSIGDVADAARLRRSVRKELRSSAARPDRHGASAARRCAAELRRSAHGEGRVVMLADATVSGTPVVVIGIVDHGRVVVFVTDAGSCDVRMAQSL